MDLSIIIVTYNSESYIENCIYSILKTTKEIKYEIIVVDNSSKDRTVEKVKSIKSEVLKVIESQNRGFNYGNNRGIEIANGKYICLLNPDTIVCNNAFYILKREMDLDSSLGLCGGKLLDVDGRENITFGCFPSIKQALMKACFIRKDKYYKANVKSKKFYVDYPIGADFFFRKEIIREIGMLDENYFLYFDETDFAFRIRKAGFKACILTEAKIIHLQGKSTEDISEFASQKFLESFVYYNKKFLNKRQTSTLCAINIIFNMEMCLLKYILKKGDYKYNLRAIDFYKTTFKEVLTK
ncbi:glycosyltransferase family 2 protein [Clostridium sp. SHJSY1]|uniref:glycosyltransferase family 2 protein n=1 Tax=Clostridium sp. SHJSY1 TaxID=2942483 RepID=UPI002874DB9B|nr:glycosyltransferase family 2 protein [Clostridium sp. SHJSY1]MDS0526650.1 glycosyltransferase family 2 protein [Clostridium sp. SHJSY1]